MSRPEFSRPASPPSAERSEERAPRAASPRVEAQPRPIQGQSGGGRAPSRGPAVICLGSAHWDLIGRPNAPLPPGGDLPGHLIRRPGGVALNLALACAARGRPTVLIAPVGRDPEGTALVSNLAARGVSLRRLGEGTVTGRYLAVEDGAGALAAAVADLPGCESARPQDLRPVLTPTAANAAAWVMEANLPAEVLHAMAMAHAALPVEARPWLAANPASPARAARLSGLLPMLDLLICNRAEAEILCGRRFATAVEAAVALQDLGPQETVVTDGPAPAACAARQEPPLEAAPEIAPAAPHLFAVTGAGDALFAAYLDARLRARHASQALEEGLRAARARMEAPA